MSAAFPATAHAAETQEVDLYQRELLEESLEQSSLEPDPAPEGKKIERIVVIVREVFDHRDPWPLFMNALHATTRPEIVTRELLFEEGDTWIAERIFETERNLRQRLFVSVARIVAARGSAPDRVVALVLAKDLWSLRTNFDFSYVGSKLELFSLELQERNLGGTMKAASVDFNVDLGAWSLGQKYSDPYLAGTTLRLEERAAIYFGRGSGKNEGALATLSVEEPLRTLDTEWGWKVSTAYQKNNVRRFSHGQVALAALPEAGQAFPFVYGQRYFRADARLTRSFGRELKQNVSVGWRGYREEYTVSSPGGALPESSAREFRSLYVPQDESAGLAALTYEMFFSDYRTFVELNSFAVSEDFRMGPALTLEARLANPIFGFDSSYFEPVAALTWRRAFGEDLFEAGVSGQLRHQPEDRSESAWINRLLVLELKNAFPRMGAFRLHARAALERRWLDRDRTTRNIGGEDALRGYPSGYFSGSQLLLTNLELRSRSFRFKSVHVGGAGFLDAADAFNDPSRLNLHASAGLGLRIVFPEFNREAIRLDFGFPLEPIQGASPSYFVAKFGQVF